jgi:hypothetical protein
MLINSFYLFSMLKHYFSLSGPLKIAVYPLTLMTLALEISIF